MASNASSTRGPDVSHCPTLVSHPQQTVNLSASRRSSAMRLAVLLFLDAALDVAADVRLGVWTNGPLTAGLADECIGMLNEVVNCDTSVLWANSPNTFYTDSTLAALCTATLQGLPVFVCQSYSSRLRYRPLRWRRRLDLSRCVQGRACPGKLQRYLFDRYVSHSISAATNYAGSRKDTHSPERRRSGKRCNSVLGKLAGIDPSN